VFASFRSIVGSEIAALGLSSAEQGQADLLDAIAKPDSGHGVAVAEASNTIAGFVSWKPNIAPGIGEITLNAVHPDHGGKGIGTALYEHALAALKAAGMQLVTVGTGGDPSHAPARRAYEKAGFSTHLPSIYMYRKL
jgi:GNAT superfamily N-acetyltransferase